MLRKVTLDDAAAIAKIYNGYIAETTATFEVAPITPDEMAERIKHFAADYPYYVFEEDGQVLGYAYAHRWHDRAAYAITAETSVYVLPGALGRGIGRALMLRIIDDCRRQGLHSLIACITAENTRSIDFHLSLGFVKVAHYRQVGCKFHRLLDVVDLQLMLDES